MEATTNQSFVERVKQRAAIIGKTILEYIETIIVILYIVNGVATFLILWGLVETSPTFNKLAGALAFAFSMFAFVAFINKGVKHETKSKKGKK